MHSTESIRVLLVDDNPFDRELARLSLEALAADGRAFEVACAGSWEEAQANLPALQPDLMLLDYHLPGADGLQVLHELAGRPHAPVIMLTGQDDVTTAVKMLRAGASDYVTKGLDWGSTLGYAVERTLTRTRLEQQLAEGRERLAAHAAELERKVTARTRVVRMQAAKIEQLYLALEETARVKTRFVSSISHEVRSTLDVILGHLEVACDGIHDPDALDALACARDGATRLHVLMESLLDLDRLPTDAGRLDPLTFDMEAFARDLRDEAEALATSREIAFQWAILPEAGVVFHDRAKLWTIAIHLIANAIRATPFGRVEVTVRIAPDGSGGIVVSHTGFSSPLDGRTVSGAPGEWGSRDGLGLGIVRRFVELLGGHIAVENPPGEPTRFEVTIPAPTRIIDDARCAPTSSPPRP